MNDPLRLSPLERASGIVLGFGEAVPELPRVPGAGGPREALESTVRRALARPPCIVGFSGGRDSSAVLAIAAHVARREGLPLPIPLTHRFPGSPASEESAWQERVVAHLGLQEWCRLDFDDELDCLGPIATDGLRRHGLLWPANIHSIVPALNAAGTGSVLTGQGGDEILHPGRYAHLARVLTRRERPQLRDAARAAFAVLPSTLRRHRRRAEATWIDCPWLRPEAQERLVDAYAATAAAEPVRRRSWVRWMWQMRVVQLTLRSMELLAGDSVLLVNPFVEPEFLSAYAAWAASSPPRTRTDALRELCGQLLPEDVIERRTKATFDGAFWCRHSESFAASLAPDDIDSELVDGERAVAFWAAGGTETSGPIPSATLLQALWLEREELGVEGGQERGGVIVESAPVTTPAER